ncbi:MAG TPA: FtsX-like permease family protein, partial [Bryobacteraceae bacterium]|nr:FtsX-like permease family protein [Bryobacteraceae bacterium]
IVGVIDDVRFWGPAAYQPIPEIYQSYQAAQWPTMNFVVKLVPPEVGPERIRAALNAADPRVTVYDVRTLRSHLNENLARPRLIIIVLGSFALFSWLLALLALAGLVAHDVRRSHPEIGIRMAVGASNWHVLALFLKRHSAPVLAGTIVGVCVSSGASSMIRSLLFEVSPLDTLVYAAVPAGLLAVAVVVTLAASFRATRVNPAVALRSE